MVRSSDSLESQLLTLPPADRARLAELLLASLDSDLDAGPPPSPQYHGGRLADQPSLAWILQRAHA